MQICMILQLYPSNFEGTV